MKTFLIFLLCLLSVSSFGQGLAIRTLNGFGTNTTFSGVTNNGQTVFNDDANWPVVYVAASNTINKAVAQYVCDGYSDEEQINAAITYVSNRNGRVVCLGGTYYIGTNITVFNSGVTLEGVGGATIFRTTNTSYGFYFVQAFGFQLGGGVLSNTTIRDITFNADGLAAQNIVGVFGQNTRDMRVEGLRFHGTGASTGYGVLLVDCMAAIVKRCHFGAWSVNPNFETRNSDGVVVSSCFFRNTAAEVYANSTNIVFEGCIGTGWTLSVGTPLSGERVTGLKISDCIADNRTNSSARWWFRNTTNAILSGNIVWGSQYAIQLRTNVSDITISGNHLAVSNGTAITLGGTNNRALNNNIRLLALGDIGIGPLPPSVDTGDAAMRCEVSGNTINGLGLANTLGINLTNIGSSGNTIDGNKFYSLSNAVVVGANVTNTLLRFNTTNNISGPFLSDAGSNTRTFTADENGLLVNGATGFGWFEDADATPTKLYRLNANQITAKINGTDTVNIGTTIYFSTAGGTIRLNRTTVGSADGAEFDIEQTAGVLSVHSGAGIANSVTQRWDGAIVGNYKSARTNSHWVEIANDGGFQWKTLRSMADGSNQLHQPLVFGVGTNWAIKILTNNFATAGGAIAFNSTIDTTATTTTNIHKNTGRVRLAAGQQSYVVTNNIVTTSTAIVATVNTDDSTATSVKAIPGAGFFTLKAIAAATADTDISFWISSP